MKDSHFTSDDISVDINTATQMFLEGKAAMFHGYPALMQEFQEQMDAELTRIPFFSQISDEAFINMTPSLNIAFNKELEKDQEKLDLAFDVLECMISKEGQTLIADGKGVISLNVDVPNMMEDVPGLEDEINNNSVYIRYSAQKSFYASLEAVHGLLSGEMDETQAYDTFRSVMNRKDPEEKAMMNFENEYSISLNDRSGRDAASSILTTIREENEAQLALAPYYYFTSSMYKGECTSSRVGMMTAKSSDTALYYAKINGKQVYELVENYLADADENFYVTNKYELPIASGMKMIVNQAESGFSLKDLTVNDKKIYYPVLYKWKKGQSAERISEGACPHFEVVKDSVVYLNSTTDVISHGELYVSRPDGINKRVLDDEIWDFVIDQDYIYYQYCYDTVGAGLGGHALHRMDVNGANSTVVAYEVNSPYLKSDYHNFCLLYTSPSPRD